MNLLNYHYRNSYWKLVAIAIIFCDLKKPKPTSFCYRIIIISLLSKNGNANNYSNIR